MKIKKIERIENETRNWKYENRAPYPPPPPNCRRVRKLLKTKGTKMGNGAKNDKNAG
jgi:hypothetical protein